jgi:hypothetical protein
MDVTELDMTLWIGLSWLRIGASGRLLRTEKGEIYDHLSDHYVLKDSNPENIN